MKIHPIANLFRRLEGAELAALADDIGKHGQRDPITVQNGVLLDGRNRLAACELAKVKPTFAEYPGDDVIAFILSKNLARRHLDNTDKTVLAVELLPHWEKEAAKRRGGDRKSAKYQPGKIAGMIGESRDHVAALVGISGRTVAAGKKIAVEALDLFEQMKERTMTLAQAVREAKRRDVVANLEDVAAREQKALSGVYDVIVIDPPWPMEKIARDERPNQVGFDYPTMSVEQIAGLAVPASDDCHLWLWTTQRFLPAALSTLETWRFVYVCEFVWHKPGGFQPIGLPQYNAEFALYARRGSPRFINTKDFPVCFNAPRGAHSEKPDAFYDMVRRVTAGRRIDMFNRRKIEGFDAWGKEAFSGRSCHCCDRGTLT